MNYRTVQPATASNKHPLTEVKARSAKVMNGKLAEVCRNLKPFQSLEFDPQQGVVVIVTELVVPSTDEAQIAEILLRNCGTAKISIRRFADNYKIALTRH
nr:hypothetical protein [Caldilineaceae bacterium]